VVANGAGERRRSASRSADRPLALPADPAARLKLIFTVHGLDAVVARLTARRTPVASAGSRAMSE
jgi:hypothetical protein